MPPPISRFADSLFNEGIFGGLPATAIDSRKLFTVQAETRIFVIPIEKRIFTVTTI